MTAPKTKPTEKATNPTAAALGDTFTRLWHRSGHHTADLPSSWREQLAVWASEGVTPQLLESYFDAWARKPRVDSPDALYRYLQVCCFNRRHEGRPRRRIDAPGPWTVDADPWSEPSWMGRDPGYDGGW